RVLQQAEQAGPRPAGDFNQQLRQVYDQLINGQGVPDGTLNTLYRAYLYNWVDNIDDALLHWSEVGLLPSTLLADNQAKRDLQNREAGKMGSDVDTGRADAEGDIGALDAAVRRLDDPNGDGSTDDSFINNHLLPMLGFPKEFGDLRLVLQNFSEAVNDLIVGP